MLERVPAHTRNGLQALYEKGHVFAKLADIDPLDVLARFLKDEKIASIAADLGVHKSALNQWLLRNHEDLWKQAQVARAQTALEDAKEAMDTAQDGLSLTRAREKLNAAKWELEKLNRRLYGDDKNIQVNVVPVLNISVAPLDVPTGSGTRIIENGE